MIETRPEQARANAIAADRHDRRRFVMAELKALIAAGFFGPDEAPMLDRGRIVDANTGQPRRFRAEDLDRMDDLGFFDGDDDDARIELIDGVILAMARVQPRHSEAVVRLVELFLPRLLGRASVRGQVPVRLGPEDEPQPDLSLVRLRPEGYGTHHPEPTDIHLVIEAMDSTVHRDRNIKLPRYAATGVPEVWLIDLPGDILEVCRNPSGVHYEDRRVYGRGQTVAPLAFPDVVLNVDDLLGRTSPT